jgi:phosphatidylglycerol:prolipoprotein diacylglycerol transferase
MSFHGGLLGMIVAMVLFARRFRIPFLELMDRCAIVAPIGICFGRLANFINGELWGRATDVQWAMIFPTGGGIPRHPSQLYEATTEGVLLFIILLLLAARTRILTRIGALSGLFLAGYALARMFCEQFREPDEQIGFLWNAITMGQLLSLPLLAGGMFLVWRAFCCKKLES